MRRLKLRRSVALVGIGALLFAATAAWALPASFTAILSPLWIVVPAVVTVIVRRRATRCDEQPVALLSLLLSRAPPAGTVA